MELGVVGLGRMGGNMATRLVRAGHRVGGFDPAETSRRAAEGQGARTTASLEELVSALEAPRTVWLMVPAGDITESTVRTLAELLGGDDLVVDGGNSNWRDSQRRAGELGGRGIAFLDVGVSGGVWGLEEGYCMTIGGRDDAVDRIRPALDALAPVDGWVHVGPAGAGHFVKMVHNGIEYGLLQAYGEGFEILERSDFDLDLPAIAQVWRNGSVIRSWLLDLLAGALARDPRLTEVRGYVEDSGEGRWTIQAAIEEDVPAPITALSLFARFASRQDESFSAKVIAALRREFGGHAVREEDG
jgi:6-phosphogluconate dehydrogenase